MRILAIGNSFSQDASRYLSQAARRSGLNIEVANIMIGGCPLERHYRNMLSGEKAYMLEYNGSYTGFNVSLTEALLTAHWDVITVQQVIYRDFKERCQLVRNGFVKAIQDAGLQVDICIA